MQKILLLPAFLFCLTTLTSRAQTSDCSRSLGEAYLDVNNVRARILNTGGLFYRGVPQVYNIPKTGNTNSIFASTIWLMGQVNGELRGSATRYGEWEMWAGPLDENGNPPVDCSTYDQLYTVYQQDLVAYEVTEIPSERLLAWPWELGAPVIDGDGIADNYSLVGGDLPAISGHQSIWWVMNDRGNVHESTEVPPLGIEVQATAFASLSDSLESINNTTLYKYLITYKGVEPLENAYFGIFADPDLGNYLDDYNGVDSALGLAFVYNADNEDESDAGYGMSPPALGYTFIQGPLADQDGLDNNGDGTVDEPGERLPMTSFVSFDNGSSVTAGPDRGPEYYNHMQGLWRDGSPILYGGYGYEGITSRQTKFMLSGNPVTGEGWTEANPGLDGSIPPRNPSDRRFAASVGPFSMQPGEQQEIVFAVVWARGDNYLDSVTELKKATREVQEQFAAGFNIPLPPQPQLAPVQLLSPSNGIADQPTNPILVWNTPPDGIQFDLEFSSSPTLDTATREEIIKNNQWAPQELLPGSTYYWRVRVVEAGSAGPWSQTWQFTTSSTFIERGTLPIAGFMTVQNAAGQLNPPDMGSFAFNDTGFPVLEGSLTPEGAYPDPEQPTPGVQQSSSNVTWGIHTGGTDRFFYAQDDGESFLERTIRRGWRPVGIDDYEWRFPQYCFDAIDGTIDDGDCLAYRAFEEGNFVEVPFELWNVGDADDPEDDYRMIPVICTQLCAAGSASPDSFAIGGDHAVSEDANDPTTPWVYWFNPLTNKSSRGETGYDAFFAGSGTNTNLGEEVFSRMVLVQLDGGFSPPYNIKSPEPGTVFRIAINPFPAPVPSAPRNAALIDISNTGLAWQGAATPYQVQVAQDSDFASTLVDSMHIEVPYFTFQQLPLNQELFWRVRTIEDTGDAASAWSTPFSFQLQSMPVNTKTSEAAFPGSYELSNNYPNPFSNRTLIRYGLPIASTVQLDVYDLLGRHVRTLVRSQQESGWHEIVFDGTSLPAGMYLYRLQTESFSQTQSMILIP